MNQSTLLQQLDEYRGTFPLGVSVIKEYSNDCSECRILKVNTIEKSIGSIIAEEKEIADQKGYQLEWKVYAHDPLPTLVDQLSAAGFTGDDPESVMIFPLVNLDSVFQNLESLPPEVQIWQVTDVRGLEEMAEISKQIGRKNVEAETKRLASILAEAPETMSIFLLKVNGEPVSCGRIYYPAGSGFAELAGGRTKSNYRSKGFFTSLVNHRLRDAHRLGRTHVLVDALPTSEPILKRLGFQFLTRTQPFIYEPTSAPSNKGK